MKKLLVILLLLLPTLAVAQDRDFLTPNETDQVRLAQEPNERLALYVYFARQRLDLLNSATSEEKPGRSKLIHDLLEDYTKIIEAIDTVSDDALKKKADLSKGLPLVADAEKAMLPQLEKIQESSPKDIARYQFVLEQAIDTLKDSIELAQRDLGERKIELATKEKQDRTERETMMRPEEVAAKRVEEKKAEESKRKAPSLRRKGEVVPEK